jgi:SAM-dependent methyltransferase
MSAVGAGAFAVELAERAGHVDALDRSPAMIEEAKRVAPPNVTCVLADVLQEPLPDARYDAIVSISALHHTPVEAVLPRLAGALRPGGVLAARSSTPTRSATRAARRGHRGGRLRGIGGAQRAQPGGVVDRGPPSGRGTGAAVGSRTGAPGSCWWGRPSIAWGMTSVTVSACPAELS